MKSRFLALIMVIAMVIMSSSITLVASQEVSVYVNNVRIEATGAFQGTDYRVMLPNYESLRKIFPNETYGLKFPDVNVSIELRPWAESYGYTIYEGNGFVELTKTTTKYFDVYLDDKVVEGVLVFRNKDSSEIMISGYYDLRKIFPVETSGVTFHDADRNLNLKAWAESYGYTFYEESSYVRLVKGKTITEYLEVYVDNKYVEVIAFLKYNNKVVIPGEYLLRKIFPNETYYYTLSNTNEEVELLPWAERFGYTLYRNGSRVYIDKVEEKVYVFLNDQKVTIDAYMRTDKRVKLRDYTVLKNLFPDETYGEAFYDSNREVDLQEYAEKYGYSCYKDGTNVYLNKKRDTTVPVIQLIIVNGINTNQIAVMQGNGEVTISSKNVLKEIFPSQTKGISESSVIEQLNLGTWARYYGYKLVQDRGCVYLNNDGRAPIKITLNDKEILFTDQYPVIRDDRVLVPVRGISEMFNAQVTWNSYMQTVLITTIQGSRIELQIGASIYYVNGVAKVLDVPARIIGDRTLVPIRFIAEALGATVEYKQGNQINEVIIKK